MHICSEVRSHSAPPPSSKAWLLGIRRGVSELAQGIDLKEADGTSTRFQVLYSSATAGFQGAERK